MMWEGMVVHEFDAIDERLEGTGGDKRSQTAHGRWVGWKDGREECGQEQLECIVIKKENVCGHLQISPCASMDIFLSGASMDN